MMQDSRSPLVSIVMPAYNAANYLQNAIDSVLFQSYKNWELIIVDDASEDESRSILKQNVALDPRIIMVALKKNRGASFSRNLAIKKARGKYIAFVDSDDYIGPDYLRVRIDALVETGADILASGFVSVDESGKQLKKYTLDDSVLGVHRGGELSPLQLGAQLYLPAHVLLADIAKRVKMSESLVISEDRKYLSDIYEQSKCVVMIDDQSYRYVMHDSSLTHNISCTAMLASVEVERILFERDLAKGFVSPGYEEYINRMLAAIRFIYKTGEHSDRLQEYKDRIERLDCYSGYLHGWRRAKYLLFKSLPAIYKLLSIFLTSNVG